MNVSAGGGLEALGERLSAGEAEDLAARLPKELAERFSGDEVRDLARHLSEPVRPCLHAARGAAARPTSWPRR